MKQTILITFASIVAAFVTYGFGGWSDLLSLFLLAIVVDYISGIAASLKEGKGLSSDVGFWGITRKGLMFLIIILGHKFDIIMSTNVIMNGSIYFYLANELISIMENYGRIGLPLPKQIQRMIRDLKDTDDPTEPPKNNRIL